jgi:hypothetical protein
MGGIGYLRNKDVDICDISREQGVTAVWRVIYSGGKSPVKRGKARHVSN